MLPRLVIVFLPIYICIIYIHNRILFCHKIKRNAAICSNTDKP